MIRDVTPIRVKSVRVIKKHESVNFISGLAKMLLAKILIQLITTRIYRDSNPILDYEERA